MINKYKIESVNIWNMNETDLQIDVKCDQWMIVSADLDDKNLFACLIFSLDNIKHIMMIESVSENEIAIDFLIIIKKVIIQAWWFADLASRDIIIEVSETEYSNNELAFLWLQHWDRLSHHHQKRIYQLLILDEVDSHLFFQFMQYCHLNKILSLCLSSHSTHLLQSLDVMIFQQ